MFPEPEPEPVPGTAISDSDRDPGQQPVTPAGISPVRGEKRSTLTVILSERSELKDLGGWERQRR